MWKVTAGFPLLITILVAGCSQNDGAAFEEDNSETLTGSSSHSASNEEIPPAEVPTTPIDYRSIAFTDCTSFLLAVPFPPGLNPGSRPAGWEPADETDPFGGIGVEAYACSRISLGPFERGPVHMVIESHGGASFPPECVRDLDGFGSWGIVATFWVDDPEVAQYLNVTYGLPVIVGSIERSFESVGDVDRVTWSWSQPGGEKSTVSVHGLPEYSAGEENNAYFWGLDSGVVRLRLPWEFQGPVTVLPGHALYKPPMLSAQLGGGVVVGATIQEESGDSSGEFTVYRDPLCEEPVP